MVESLEQRVLCSATVPDGVKRETSSDAPWPDASSVTLTHADGSAGPIVRKRDTWIIIHGLTGSKNTPGIRELAAAVDRTSPNDQVLVVDWHNLASADIPGKMMEASAEATADVIATKLRKAKLASGRINLIGYSMGGLVAARVASDLRDRGGVNALVALDPASPRIGNASPGGPVQRAAYNLAANSKYSIAFHGQDIDSPLMRALSADDTVRIDDIGDTTGARHAGVFEVFTHMVEADNSGTPDDVSQVFSLQRIQYGSVPHWRKNSYDMDGANAWGYEAVLTADGQPGSLTPESLAYVQPGGVRRQVFAA